MEELLFFTALLTAIAHVLSGPDHLSAVTPIMLEVPKKSYLIGWSWAMGHCLGILIIGIVYLLVKESLPFDEISLYSEQVVGIVLIVIGARAFYKYRPTTTKPTNPTTEKSVEDNFYQHPPLTNTTLPKAPHSFRKHILSTLLVGTIHGLAGVAHFFLFLPVLSLKGYSKSMQYITGFGLGTILAMTLYAFAISKVAKYAKKNGDTFLRNIRLTGGSMAILVGIYWIYTSF